MVADRLDDIFGPASEFEPFSKGGGERPLLPDNTRVLAEVVSMAGKEYQAGKFTVDGEYKIVGLPASLGNEYRTGGHLWDNFRLTYPLTAADVKGLPDETVKRWKQHVAMWTRRVAVFGFSREAAWPVGGPTVDSLTAIWGSLTGYRVIIRVGVDAAGRTYTAADGTEKTTTKGKNTVQDYELASTENLERYGLAAPTATPF